MKPKTEALINVVVAIVVLAAVFFSRAFSVILAVGFLLVTAAYKYFYAPKVKA
jgi:hypothetical protein